jgi:hypothetical protein
LPPNKAQWLERQVTETDCNTKPAYIHTKWVWVRLGKLKTEKITHKRKSVTLATNEEYTTESIRKNKTRQVNSYQDKQRKTSSCNRNRTMPTKTHQFIADNTC